MFLNKLVLINFKNYREATLDFHGAVNCFTGINGCGKTNLLDAIHYLSMTKSYFSSGDTQNILHGEQMLMVQGEFVVNGIQETVMCGVRHGQKKQFKRNQDDYERLSDHIGAFPVVMIAPTDQELITEGSEIRRRFMDGIISQFDHVYLDDLIKYHQVLSQRNALLKQSSAKGMVDWGNFSVWDDQLAHFSARIYNKRKEFIEGFNPFFHDLFNYISNNNDTVSVSYESQLTSAKPGELLFNSRSKDLDMLYTTTGIHKDDVAINLKGFSAKKFASQGQQKSLVIALKLAHFSYLCNLGFSKPIVLLDDIMDKLDEGRVERLMQLVSRDEFGQLFITDSHKKRLPGILERIQVPYKHFKVEEGVVTEFENAAVT